MAEDSELEQRAVEELLRETNRARLRAETMGPAGWLKCPLRSTNKRFLLNTLRSAGMQRTNTEPRAGPSATRGRLRSNAPSRSRSRSPPRERRSTVGHRDHKNQQHRDNRNYQDKKEDRDKQRGHRDRDSRDRRRGEDGQNKRHSS